MKVTGKILDDRTETMKDGTKVRFVAMTDTNLPKPTGNEKAHQVTVIRIGDTTTII